MNLILLRALLIVESGGGRDIIGDHGRAVGPLQIHRCVVQDVNRVYGTHYRWPADCHKLETSAFLASAYLRIHCGDSQNFEQLSRTWNGGPSGPSKKSTLGYWNKVKAHIK